MGWGYGVRDEGERNSHHMGMVAAGQRAGGGAIMRAVGWFGWGGGVEEDEACELFG